MARATISNAKPSGRRAATTSRGKAGAAAQPVDVKAAKAAKAAPGRRGAEPAAPPAAGQKEDLRARIEKLERANSTLRAKNKELRVAYVASAEKVDELTLRIETLERRAGRQAKAELASGGTPRGRAASRRAAATAEDESADEEPGSRQDEGRRLALVAG